HQSIELLQHVLNNEFSAADFSNSLRSFYTPANIGFPYLVLELCRNNSTPFNGSLTQTVLLRNGQNLSDLLWYPEELSVLSELTYPTTITGLLASTGIREPALRKILGVFDKLGIIDVKTESESYPEPVAIVKRRGFPFDGLIPVVSNAVVSEKL